MPQKAYNKLYSASISSQPCPRSSRIMHCWFTW